ncbi:sugar phosphate isomerase/epimerase [bacterium]|nr:sugar phosphate isomerase/epimerase [bacterium]
MENLNILGANIPFGGKIEIARRNIENLVKTGYRIVYFNGDFLDTSVTEEKLKEVSKIISDTPLIPFSAHNLPIFPENPEKQEEIIPFQEEIFEKAKILGVKSLTCHFGWCKGLASGEDFEFDKFLKRKNITLEDYRKKNIEVLKTLCQKASKYNITLTIENLPAGCLSDLSTTMEDLLKIIEDVNEPNLKICLDSGHGFISGINLYEGILKIKDKLFETHFHDNLGKISNSNSINDLHQPCGIGKINWIEIIAGLEKINFKNPVVFEIGSEYENLEINKRNWERFYKIYKEKLPGWPQIDEK